MTDWIKTAREAEFNVPGFKFVDGGVLNLPRAVALARTMVGLRGSARTAVSPGFR
jgi:hypothetical protein